MEGNIYLRRADREDVELFFRWVNEPAVRENSFNTEPIPNVDVVDMSNAADTLCEEIRREGIVWKKA